jgi:succinate dehydrogenase/fumarate reductase flavoprotein subunit
MAKEMKEASESPISLDGEGVRWVTSILERREGIPVEELRHRIREIAQQELNIVREGSKLKAALSRLNELQNDDLQNLVLAPPKRLEGMGRSARSQAVRSAIETRNLCLVARMLVSAAILRTESRGAHYRLDHPETDPAWNRVTCIRKGSDGELSCEPIPVDN